MASFGWNTHQTLRIGTVFKTLMKACSIAGTIGVEVDTLFPSPQSLEEFTTVLLVGGGVQSPTRHEGLGGGGQTIARPAPPQPTRNPRRIFCL